MHSNGRRGRRDGQTKKKSKQASQRPRRPLGCNTPLKKNNKIVICTKIIQKLIIIRISEHDNKKKRLYKTIILNENFSQTIEKKLPIKWLMF